jgi:serine/threonine protein kinase
MATVSENQWVDHYGFQRFPFDRQGSGNEEFARPEFLASGFVEPPGFEQAFRPVTSLLFAARGTGKTACRVMMDYYCRNGLARLSETNFGQANYVLSVPHVYLDNVHEIARQSTNNNTTPPITVEHHVIEIMRQAIPAFVELIASNPAFLDSIQNLSRPDFEDISFYLILYSIYLSSTQKEFLAELKISMPPFEVPMRGLVGQMDVSARQASWGSILYQQRLSASPLFHLAQWAKLMSVIGVKATYVLVDGVDEITESAEDPNFAHYLIRPLLTYSRLMDQTHYLALKFFLPLDIESIIISDRAFRPDRGYVIQKIEWREEDLINILRKRLTALSKPDYDFRDQTAISFDSLCVPELRGEIEIDLVRSAHGNPRYLMNLCAQMVMSHCSREISNQDNEFELNKDDYLDAVERVKATYQRIEIRRELQEGEVLNGRYRVEKIINTSHSQVMKAWDERLSRYVAIKSPYIKQFDWDDKLADKFYMNLRREAELLAKLRHQNIGQVFDLLQDPLAVIMEWIDGLSIYEILDKKEKLPVHEILKIGLGIADALAYAHRHSVMHRDIHPKNIILTLDKTPKLIDFDIARGDLLETITMREDRSRFRVGTPRYSSPEQLAQLEEVLPDEIGPASDIFSLGVVLYEMLTLDRPYKYGNRLTQYENGIFPTSDPNQIPEPFYKILVRMLDGKPSNRPTAHVLKVELQNCIQTQKPAEEEM